MAATGHQRRSAIARTTNAPARASSDERESVNRRAAAQSATSASDERPAARVLPGDPRQQEGDDERERRRQRADEARHEAPEEAVFGVERPVVRQAAGAVVVEPELVAEVADGARAAPPLDVHRIQLDEPADGERSTGAEQRPADPAQLVAAQDQRPAEEVRDHGDEAVAEAVEDGLRAGCSVQHVLRDERVEADDGCEREREPVHGARLKRQRACADRVRDDARHGHREQHLLPRLHDVDLPPAQPGVVEQRRATRLWRASPTMNA